jgi:hypothetical protein
MALAGSIGIVTQWAQTPANVPGALPVQTSLNLTWPVKTGVLVDLADQKYSKIKSLAATPFVINLLTDLVDAQGVPFVPARVKAIVIHNLSMTPGQVILFGYATTTTNAHAGIVSNPGQITIRPSTAIGSPGTFTAIAPDATGYLVDSTHKLSQFDPGANTISMELEIICSSV